MSLFRPFFWAFLALFFAVQRNPNAPCQIPPLRYPARASSAECAPRESCTWATTWALWPTGSSCKTIRLLLLHRRLACAHHRLRRPRKSAGKDARRSSGLAGCWSRPGQIDHFYPEPCSATCGASPAFLNDDAAGLAGTSTDIQGAAGKPQGRDLSTYGFLGYPLLQAADILAYKAQYVPVGKDQVAHVELTREVARRFNSLYRTEVFPEPEALLTPSPSCWAPTAARCRKATGIQSESPNLRP